MTLQQIKTELVKHYGDECLLTLVVRNPKTGQVEVATSEENLSFAIDAIQKVRNE